MVPDVLTAPTVIADGALPGEVIPAYPTNPLSGLTPTLPAETTTMRPARTAFSTACTSGSSAAGARMTWPSDRFTTWILNRVRLATANSSAAMTLLVDPLPLLLRTFSPTNVTAGATPMELESFAP